MQQIELKSASESTKTWALFFHNRADCIHNIPEVHGDLDKRLASAQVDNTHDLKDNAKRSPDVKVEVDNRDCRN